MSAETTARQARVERKTKETEISLQLNLDGTGASKVQTPIPFFSHMLEAWAKHGLMDFAVEAQGDVDVDQHHTVEDVGIVLGQALRLALGDKKGIVRYGTAFVPMDEALVSASVDLSGRPFLVFGVPVARTRVSNFDLDLLQEFFRAFAFNAELTACDHALRPQPAPHHGGGVQSRRPRARRRHAAEPAHRRDPAVHEGRSVNR